MNVKNFKNTRYKKIVGVALIVFGFVALVTPVLPGAWLIFVGLELLGFEILFWTKIKQQARALFERFRR